MKKLLFDGNKNVVGKQIRCLRVQKGWSQAQLAIKMQILGVEIEGEMVSRIERNQRIVTDYEFACFCRVLEVSERELLGEVEEN